MSAPPTDTPYRAALYHLGGPEPRGWYVEGPGLIGWQGIIPRAHDGMTQEAATQMAELLNRAWRIGSEYRAGVIRAALGVSDGG